MGVPWNRIRISAASCAGHASYIYGLCSDLAMAIFCHSPIGMHRPRAHWKALAGWGLHVCWMCSVPVCHGLRDGRAYSVHMQHERQHVHIAVNRCMACNLRSHTQQLA